MTPLFGLILAGGASKRMQRDKAVLHYHGRPQLETVYELLTRVCAATFVSVRPDQRDEPTRAALPQIVDRQPGIGPLAGISAALLEHRKAAWLVVACDLPFIDESVLRELIAQRDPARLATAYRSSHDGLPEPLCAIWEPAACEAVLAHIAAGKQCPRKLLIGSNCKLIDLPDPRALDNVNTAEELSAAVAALGTEPGVLGAGQNAKNLERSQSGNQGPFAATSLAKAQRPAPSTRLNLRIQYFAILREQAGRSEEMIDTTAATPADVYEELKQRHRFRLASTQLKVALNSEFSDWHTPLKNGDTVVFIPPVAGG
jgi:molybdopterin-guanine dinucleotide biosynthesis protein A